MIFSNKLGLLYILVIMLNFSENAHVRDSGIVRDHGINLIETSSNDRMNKQGQGPTADNCITVSQSFNKN